MARKMKALLKANPGPGLEFQEVDPPNPKPNEVLIRVQAASICGTDLHIWRWDQWAQERIYPPLIIGHEFCGEVVEVGEQVTEVKVGDFVSAESHITDGTCDMCRTGRAHLCRNTQIIGVDRDGCFADFITMPAINLWTNPPDMPLEIATLQENFGNAVHTTFATELTARKVLVTGCGPVGLMTIAVAKAAGARAVYATDLSPYRLELAKKMGADLVLNPQEADVVAVIQHETEGEGVDVLLEMSGAASAINQGFSLLKPGGQAVLLGLPGKPIEFDLAKHVIFKGATVHGIHGRRLWETWYQARGLLRSSAVDLSPIVTHKFPLEKFAEGFALMESGNCGKVVFLLGER